jgi:hypothetical protein
MRHSLKGQTVANDNGIEELARCLGADECSGRALFQIFCLILPTVSEFCAVLGPSLSFGGANH